MRAYQLLTILLIFSLPFLTEQFVNTSIKSSIIIYAILLLPVFFRAFLEDIRRKFIPTILFLIFLACSTISTLLSTNLDLSIMQLLLFYSYFIIFVSIRLVFPTLKDKQMFIFFFLLLIFILSGVSSYNILIHQYVDNRFLSFIWVYHGHNHLSALLVFAIPLMLYFLNNFWYKLPSEDYNLIGYKKGGRFFLVLSLCFLLVSLLLTFSIGAMISLAISFLIVFMLFRQTLFHKKFPLKKGYMSVFLIIAFLSLSTFLLFSETKGLKTLNFRKNPQTNLASRLVYWQAAYGNFLKNPLWGSGLETFQKVFTRFDHKGSAANTSHAHNFFIQMLTDSGIFGFLISIALISSILILSAKNALTSGNFLYMTLFSALSASTLFSMVDLDWHVPVVFLIFWVFASLATDYAK